MRVFLRPLKISVQLRPHSAEDCNLAMGCVTLKDRWISKFPYRILENAAQVCKNILSLATLKSLKVIYGFTLKRRISGGLIPTSRSPSRLCNTNIALFGLNKTLLIVRQRAYQLHRS